jgi:hypothetical protein
VLRLREYRLLFDLCSCLRRSVVDSDLQHRVFPKQFFRGLICSGVAFKLCLKMPIDHKCEAAGRCNVSALNISWLLLLVLMDGFFDCLGFDHSIAFL